MRAGYWGITLLLAVTAASLIVSVAHAPPAVNAADVKVASAGGPGSAATIASAVTLTPVIAHSPPHADPELRLIGILDDFRRGDIDDALSEAEGLVRDKPNFRLANLVYGDLLASRAGVPVAFEARSSEVGSLLAEVRQRWKHYRGHQEAEFLPQPLLQMADSQDHALVVDLARSRMFVFRNRDGHPELISDHYVSGGKNGANKQIQGDRKTPVGVYFVVDRLPGEELPDKYGPVTLPVDYPNEWDVRQGRTGGGIWLHGVASSTYSRPPLDSDGCVALSNEELELIAPLLREGSTPVIIGENIEWISDDDIDARRLEIEDAVEKWRSDWESGETSRYLGHYSEEFLGRGMNKGDWDKYKTRVTRNKRFIEVVLDDVSMFEHPYQANMLVVSFNQRYTSDTFSSEARKRQYWRAEADGSWRIISEENVLL